MCEFATDCRELCVQPGEHCTVDILAVKHFKQGFEALGFCTDIYNHCHKSIVRQSDAHLNF